MISLGSLQKAKNSNKFYKILKRCREGVQNGLEVAKMLDFEFFRVPDLKGPYLGYFKRFFSQFFYVKGDVANYIFVCSLDEYASVVIF